MHPKRLQTFEISQHFENNYKTMETKKQRDRKKFTGFNSRVNS